MSVPIVIGFVETGCKSQPALDIRRGGDLYIKDALRIKKVNSLIYFSNSHAKGLYGF